MVQQKRDLNLKEIGLFLNYLVHYFVVIYDQLSAAQTGNQLIIIKDSIIYNIQLLTCQILTQIDYMQGEDIRYIENPFKKIYNIIQPDPDKLYKILFNLIEQFLKETKMPTLQAVASDPKQTYIDISAYAGVSGYIYTLIRIYKFMVSQKMGTQAHQKISSMIFKEDNQMSKLKNPDFYLQLAMQQYILVKDYVDGRKNKRKNSLAFYMSETCAWVCGMHLGYISDDVDLFRDNEKRLLECYNYYRNHNKVQMMWQLLYGIPGLLYCFLELQRDYDKQQNQKFRTNFSPVSVALTHDIFQMGIMTYQQMKKQKIDLSKQLPQDFRLIYLFHKKQYLGGAHGIGGNLNILLLSIKMNGIHKFAQYFQAIKKSIIFLINHFINGNFSTSAGSQRIKLVHFCHGAPGIISALARYYLMFPQDAIKCGIIQALKKALDHIWNYGVLKKGFGLCHGITGNAYAFFCPSIQQVFEEDKKQLYNKSMLFGLLREQKDVMEQIRGYNFNDRYRVGVSDNPYSMMLGSAGDICFYIDLFRGKAQFPGFDF